MKARIMSIVVVAVALASLAGCARAVPAASPRERTGMAAGADRRNADPATRLETHAANVRLTDSRSLDSRGGAASWSSRSDVRTSSPRARHR